MEQTLAMHHFPDNIMASLKETVVNVFWKKSDVRALFERCGVPQTATQAQDWEQYKYFIVSPVLDALNGHPDGIGPLRRILQEALAYKDGDHLLWLPDGQKRKREAERCLEHLRLLVKDQEAAMRTAAEERETFRRKAQESRKGAAFQARREVLKQRFLEFYQESDAQRRGYLLEKLLYDLFDLFDLEPRGSFKLKAEQIDGALVLDGDDLLLEAKWQQAWADLKDLRDLDGAVASNLDNTLGLFVSVNSFSPDGVQRYREAGRPRIICMDGGDLITVLEGHMDLRDLLRRKRAIAAQTGKVFVRAADILQGKE